MPQRILVIEDNPADATLIRLYLEELALGYDILEADSLRDGFALIDQQDIDLVLLDLSLTDSIGFGTLEKFLRECPNIPVIVMTGLNNDIVGVQCVRAGAQDFLVKGEFNAKALVKSIRHSMQRFQTQMKLRESTERLSVEQSRIREAQELAQFANWEMNLVSNAMKWADEMYKIFGLSSQQGLRSLSDYIQCVFPEDKAKVEAFFEAAMRDEEVHKTEHRIVVNNQVKYLALRAKTHIDTDTGQLLLIGSAQDITDQVIPSDSHFSSRQLNKAHLHQTLAILSQQVKAALFNTMNSAHLMEKTASRTQLELVGELRSHLAETWFSVHNLLHGLPDTAYTPQVDISDFNLTHLVQTFSDWASAQAAQQGTTVAITNSTDPAFVLRSDEHLLLLILLNLFRCVDRTSLPEEGLAIEFTVHLASAQPLLKVKFRHFPLNITTQAWEAFYHAAEDQQVVLPKQDIIMPLGIAKKLIRLLQGQMEVTSNRKGIVSLHEVSIPVALPASVQIRGAEHQQGQLPSAMCILLVDDHALHRIAGRSTLLKLLNDVRIELADSGQAAVGLAARASFDLILLDLQMPQMDGFETLKALRVHTSAPVLAVSPQAQPEEAADCLAKGFAGYIGKPLSVEGLREALHKMFVSH